jgi:predicted  nucleic acid-binding Zn-ribbon protein
MRGTCDGWRKLEVVMTVLRDLYQLQLVDSEREQKQVRLAEVEAKLGDSRDVIRAREDVAETRASLERLRIQMRDLELQTAGFNAKLKQNQDRLYGGRVRNPKELSSLQEEAAALRRHLAELEDNQLDLMIAIEEQEAELAERQARLQQIEATWHDAQATLLAEKEQLELRLADLAQQAEGWRDRVGAVDLALYDDLRDSLGGRAVVQLKRGICQACGVDVPTGLARSVERGEGMQHCPTCNRLLYGGQ